MSATTTARILSLIAGILLLSGCSFWGDGSGLFASDRASGEESIESFVGSLKLRNGDPETMYRLAVHYQKTGRHDWAIEEFRNILAVEPSFARAYNGIGVSLDSYKKYQLAQKAYLKALEIDSELDYAWNNLGYSALLQGKPEAAAAYFEKALTLRKDNPRYLNNLALARRQMEERGEPSVETLADLPLPPNYPPTKVWKKIQPYDGDSGAGVVSGKNKRDTLARIVAPNLSPDIFEDRTQPFDRTIPADAQRENAQRVVVQPFKAMAEDVTFTVTPVIPVRTVSQGALPSPAIISLGQESPSQNEKTLPNFRTASLLVNTQRLDSVIEASEGPYIEIANGNGVTGMAATVKGFLTHKGFPVLRVSNAENFGFGHTKVLYREGSLQQAWAVAKVIPGQQNFERVDTLGTATIGVKVILGRDLKPFHGHFQDRS